MAGKGEGEGGGKRGEEMTLPPYFYDVPETEERKRTAWIVPLLVIANAAVLTAAMLLNNCPAHNGGRRGCLASGFLGRFSFQPIRENPLLGPSSHTLEKFGALQWDKVVHKHQWWRLFSSIWLHAGIIHLLVGSLSLIFIGIRFEKQFGIVRVGGIYIVSGLGGSVLSCLYITKGITVGSSGALFGLLGAMLSELISNWAMYSNRVAAVSTILLVIVLNLIIGILPLVNNFAHIVGFISGFLLGFVLLIRPQIGWINERSSSLTPPASKYKFYQIVFLVTSIISLLVGFTVSLVMLFRGVNGSEGCEWCKYMNCVPTSKWSCEN